MDLLHRINRALGQALGTAARTAAPIVPQSVKPTVVSLKERLDDQRYPDRPVVLDFDGFQMEIVPSASHLGRALYDGTPILNGTRIHEEEFANLFRNASFDGMNVLDLGANWGYFSLLTWSSCQVSRVVAFEPHPDNAVVLRNNVRLNEAEDVIQVVEKAVADEVSESELWDIGDGVEADHNSLATDTFVFENRELEPLTVEVTTVEAYLNENSLDEIDFLKIDVEGAEGSVLEGIGDAWSRIDGIGIEIHEARMADFGHTLEGLVDTIRSNGKFDLFGLDNDGGFRRFGATDIESMEQFFEKTTKTVPFLLALRSETKIHQQMTNAFPT